MTMATNLQEAAYLTYDQIAILFPDATALQAALDDFVTAADPVLPDDIPNNHPVGNWLIPLATLRLLITPSGPNANCPQLFFDQMVDGVSKMCWAGRRAQLAGAATGITGAQATALLAAWNTAFGT
jgi:hypothetical protein